MKIASHLAKELSALRDANVTITKLLDASREESARLRSDQEDWRKAMGLVASAIGIDTLSGVAVAERVLTLRAQVTELAPGYRLPEYLPTERRWVQDALNRLRVVDSGDTIGWHAHQEIRQAMRSLERVMGTDEYADTLDPEIQP